jgi:NADPH:quinone reductase-like Zn-dependent oxidoreductase
MSQEPVVKAIVLGTRTGSPAVLELKDVDQPVPGDGDVLVRVRRS